VGMHEQKPPIGDGSISRRIRGGHRLNPMAA
jgi:hypothetical protein